MARYTQRYAANATAGLPERFEYTFWLAFSRDGDVKLSRTRPSVGRDSRAMSCTAVLPVALFTTPELKATINVAAPAEGTEFQIDAVALAEAMRGALGVDVDIRINEP